MLKRKIVKPAGLTLVEMLVVVSLLTILLSLGTILFSNFARQDEMTAAVGRVISVLDEAQVKTLAGYSKGGATSLNYGVAFTSQTYTLFSGLTFNPSEPTNQRFSLPENLTFSQINLPNQAIVFEKISGQVVDFNPSQNYLLLTAFNSNQEKKISVNKIGVVIREEP